MADTDRNTVLPVNTICWVTNVTELFSEYRMLFSAIDMVSAALTNVN